MKKKKLPELPEVSEWDLSKGFGILPEDMDLMQNVGCVGSTRKKQTNQKMKTENKQ